MITKKDVCFDIKKERIIGILDSQLNHANTWIRRDGINNALKLKKIARNNFLLKIYAT